jgi:hypothetical protein
MKQVQREEKPTREKTTYLALDTYLKPSFCSQLHTQSLRFLFSHREEEEEFLFVLSLINGASPVLAQPA